MSETVSIIDDEASVREAVGMLLESNGYTTAAFASVSEFLNAPFAGGGDRQRCQNAGGHGARSRSEIAGE